MLLPRTCPLCHRPGAAPCDECASALEGAPNLPAPAGVDVCHALLAYEGDGRELVARLKYRNARTTVRWLVAQMAVLVDRHTVDVVTWVPTTNARRRRARLRSGAIAGEGSGATIVPTMSSFARTCARSAADRTHGNRAPRRSCIVDPRQRLSARATTRLARRRCRDDGLDDHGRGTNTQSGRCRSNRRRCRGTNTAQAGAHESRHQRR